MKPSVLVALSLPIAAAMPFGAQAATATGTVVVTATVLDACVVVAAPLVFGTFNPIGGSALDGTSLLTVTCTTGTPYNIRLSAGANGSSVTARKMIRTGGSDLLNYGLYRDTNHTLNWGLTDNTDTLTSSGTGLVQTHTIYGRILSTENAPAGAYTDTITVTVNY